jgi:hypothetical protein
MESKEINWLTLAALWSEWIHQQHTPPLPSGDNRRRTIEHPASITQRHHPKQMVGGERIYIYSSSPNKYNGCTVQGWVAAHTNTPVTNRGSRKSKRALQPIGLGNNYHQEFFAQATSDFIYELLPYRTQLPSKQHRGSQARRNHGTMYFIQ